MEILVESIDTVLQRFEVARRQDALRSAFNFIGEPEASREAADDEGPAPPDIMDIIGKAKKTPAATSVAAVPSAVTERDVQNLLDISLLDTYVSAASALLLYKRNPTGFDITNADGAAAFTRELANARLRVMTQGLAGVLSLSESKASSFSKQTTAVDLHLEFLENFFGSFGFAPAAMKQLDGVMTNIVKNLGALKAGWSDQSQTLDHLISIYYFEDVMGLDAKIPKMRLFYLHIDQRSWTAAIGKSSVNQFTFNMNYSDQTATMSLTQMAASRDKIENYVTTMTDRGLEEIRKLTAMTAVKQDAA